MNQKDYLSKENVESIWELSLLQKELFDQYEANEKGRNHLIRLAFPMDKAAHPDRIRDAWGQVVQKNPLLRIVLRKARNRTVQVVLKEYPALVEIIDVPFFSWHDYPVQFNLMEEPGVKLIFARQDDGRKFLFLCCHPVIMDKNSLISLSGDFMTILFPPGPTDKNVSSLMRPSFKEYLDWLAQQYWAPALTYWQKELSDFVSATSLLNYIRFNKKDTHPYTTVKHDLTAEQSAALECFCRQERWSPSIIVQASWALLLNIYSREKNIYFGVELQGPQAILGPFANILPIYAAIDNTKTAREFLKTIAEKNKHLLQYSYIPLGEIRTHTGLPLDTVLFETIISVNPESTKLGDPAGPDARQDRSHPFALEVSTGEKWQLAFHCFENGLPGAVALQVLKRLETIMIAIGENPAIILSQLKYLSHEESEKLNEFNQSGVHFPAEWVDRLMHQIFEEQVEKNPMTIACTWGNRQVSYGELNGRANRLAHWLKEQGVGAGDLVGIFCERSIEMLIAILATFKAGGAYIPLDPANPDARIKTILLDSRAKVVFTGNPELWRTFQLIREIQLSTRLFCLECFPVSRGETMPAHASDAAILRLYTTGNPPLVNRPRDIAYIIFTSGSTGVPKGAIVEHMGMVNHLWTKIRLLQLSPAARVAQNASHCFDISVWQFLSALMVGGQTVIFSSDVAMTPWIFKKNLWNSRVNILEMVPAMIETILEDIPGIKNSSESRLPDLHIMLSTGEALSTALCLEWTEKYPHIPLVNAYGPTECSDDTHHRVVSPANPPEDYYNEVPLGNIIPNFRTYILDDEMRILPPGCPGEICLTGTGVGKGYLNNPERTAGTFVKNIFNDGVGNVMYRTGDLGFIDNRGQLVFLGRIDYQVKVRGFRIELGEIEARLRKHPAVKQCIVIIGKDSGRQNTIIAYTVLKERILPMQLHTYLEESLPHYMIPEHIIELNNLPLNRSGKIDRKALPAPGLLTQSLNPSEIELPVTQIEKKLVHIWEEVLEISPIGLNQNFFELGGHSLRIIQVRSRINQLLGIDIPVLELFRKQTVQHLAQWIEEHYADAAAAKKTNIVKVPSAPYYPMSHTQQRLFFLHQLEPDNIAYNLITAMEMHIPMQIDILKKTLQTIIRRQASLRTTFGWMDDKPVQFVLEDCGPDIWFKFEDFSSLSHGDADRQKELLNTRLQSEARFKFDLTKVPLFYTVVFKLEDRKYLLFFNMHHIIGDLWSWEILFKELFIIYQDYIEGKDVSLPALPVQYTDYAVWQDACIKEGLFKAHEEYWSRQLAGEIPVLDLPMDFPRPPVQKYSAGVVSREFPGSFTEPLYRLFQQKDVTSFIGFLSLFYAFLNGISGQEDIIIGIDEAGRGQVEIETLIGFFINTLPFRLDMEGNPSFFEIIDRVKQVSLEAHEHAEYPLDLIINRLDLERDLSRYPLYSVIFQVMANETQMTDNKAASGTHGISIPMTVHEVPTGSTNYDLEAILSENKKQGELSCTFLYCKDLFKEETIQRWVEYFITYCQSIIRTPNDPISKASMLTEEQKNQLLNQWNDTHMYILNSALVPVPIGITGELYIGGDDIAPGYLDNPELTREKFGPLMPLLTQMSQMSLIKNIQHSELYKTGYLARYREDGNIEYLGREDSQVRIRGSRVDLSEIEAVLEKHIAVKQAVVVNKKDSLGKNKLISYLVKDEKPIYLKKEKSGKALKILGVSIHSIDHFANIPMWKYSLPFLYLKKYLSQYPLYEDIIFESVDYYQNTPDEEIYNEIFHVQPDMILFSVYVWNIEKHKRIAPKIKENNDRVMIVLGGPEVAADEIEILKENNAFDIIIRGEGEKTFYELIDAILNNNDLTGVKGIVYRHGSEIRQNEDQALLDLDELPSVFDNNIFDWKQLKSSIVALETQRGCNFSCGFCQYRKGHHRIRYFPLAKVFKELEFIKSTGCECLYLMDPTFNSDRNRACEILRYIIRLNMNVKVIAEMIPEYLDDELLELAARAGMLNIEIGVQSLNKNALKTMNRGQKLHDIETNIRLAYSKNINVIPQLIYGLPGDTFQEYCHSFDWLYMLDVDEIAAYHLLVLRGSPFYKNKDLLHLIYDVNPPHWVISNATFEKEEVVLAGKMTAVALSTQYTLRKSIKNYCLNKGIKPSFFFLMEVGLESFAEQLSDSFPIYNEKHYLIQMDCLKRIAGVLIENDYCTDEVRALVNETEMLFTSRFNTIKKIAKTAYYDQQYNDDIKQDIRRFCEEQLPSLMVPASFIFLDQMPLTDNGEINRGALPDVDNLEKKLPIMDELPRNKIEKSLSKVWEDVLEVSTIKINDNFFEMGGHSLKGIKLISKLRAQGINLSINELFLHQTIKAQAHYILETHKKDEFLFKTHQEAENSFAEEFKSKGKFVVYHIDGETYNIFYIDVKGPAQNSQAIARFFKDHLTETLCPHYIRPLSQAPGGNRAEFSHSQQEFDSILQLQEGEAADILQQLDEQIKQGLANFNKNIIKNETIKQYNVSPIQAAHLGIENRLRVVPVTFNEYLDVPVLEEAFLELIVNHGLLRSSLVNRENGEWAWNEFRPPQHIAITHADLIDCSPEVQEKIMSETYRRLAAGSFGENSILYHVVLFRKNLRDYRLAIYLDHAIYDGMSGDIIERQLRHTYRLKEQNTGIDSPSTPAPRPYSDYVELLSGGPQDINEAELIDFFALREFDQCKKKFETIFSQGDTGRINLFYYELGFPGNIQEEKAWELAFVVFNILLKKYFGLSTIPIKIVSYGRRYGGIDFFDTVGEFLDFVPVPVHVDEENPTAMVEDAGKKLDKAALHHINFMSFLYDRRLKEMWPETSRLMAPERLDADDVMILFNFSGKSSEEEMNRWKQQYRGAVGKESKICSLQAEIYYTHRAVYFYISSTLDMISGAEIGISNDELKDILSKMK
ncbi:MAG TPA: amino acid adenylation domain-containing protein [Candidatus Deferrimicrobium sp.]|nr:amino acid adenylation domain-containing protein [Candidatus Deferrimicrobium sp.]